MQSKVSRVLHMKKEKSRNAARSRRGKENYEFYELAKLLPISPDTSSQLDKASIVRLTMSHLQLQKFVKTTFSPGSQQRQSTVDECHACSGETFKNAFHKDIDRYFTKNLGPLILQSLDGFMFVLNEEGRFLYVSNSVSECLGLPQVDLMGTTIFNYIHPADHAEVVEHLRNECYSLSSRFCKKYNSVVADGDAQCSSCSFFVRMKSTLTRRGIGIKSSGYKVVHITGRSCMAPTESETSSNTKSSVLGFTGIAQILPPPSLMDIQSDLSSFVSRLNPGLFFKYCEERISTITGYSVDEVRGHSLYEFIHSSDIPMIKSCHKEVLSKGQVVTPYYRWLTKNGSYIWLQSCGTLIADKPQDGEEEAFIWINYLIASDEDLFFKDSEDVPSTTTQVSTASQNNGEASVDHDHPSTTASNNRKRPLMKIEIPPRSKRKRNADARPNPLPRPHHTCSAARTHTSASRIPPPTKIDPANTNSPEGEKSSKFVDDDDGDSNGGVALEPEAKMWFNPPNKEVSNHRDLPAGVQLLRCLTPSRPSTLPIHPPSPSVIHHHYPFGINPHILNSNPLLAKMFGDPCTGAASSSSSSSKPPYFCPTLYGTPLLNIMAPVISTLQAPHLDYSPASIATVLDELRKDPMRKVSPPNKVVLPRFKSEPPGADDLYYVDDGHSVSRSFAADDSAKPLGNLSALNLGAFSCNKYLAKLMLTQMFK